MINKRNIRIKDIAQLAGVSVGTVDRVLHNRGRVSEEALKKVTMVLNQIDYKPNLIARTLSASKVYRIAALVPDPSQDPYWAQSNAGMLQARTEWEQYGVTVEPFLFDLYDKNSFVTMAQLAYQAQPDGILIAPLFYHEALSFFELPKTSKIPVVLFNTNIPEIKPMSFIGQNLYQSGRVSAELMHNGHRGGGLFIVLHVHEDLDNAIHLLEKERGFREYFSGALPTGEFELQTLNLGNPEDPSFHDQLSVILTDSCLRGIFVSTSKASYIASFLELHKKTGITLIGYDLLEENLRHLRSGTINFLIHQNPGRQALLGISLLANHLVFKKEIPVAHLFPLEIITHQNLESHLKSESY